MKQDWYTEKINKIGKPLTKIARETEKEPKLIKLEMKGEILQQILRKFKES